jgi:hypothetical protein
MWGIGIYMRIQTLKFILACLLALQTAGCALYIGEGGDRGGGRGGGYHGHSENHGGRG